MSDPAPTAPDITKTFYIVFSPQGTTSPKRIYATHPEALSHAHKTAKLYQGQDFYVMKSKSRPIRYDGDDDGGTL